MTTNLHTDDEFDRWTQMQEEKRSPFQLHIQDREDDSESVSVHVQGHRAGVWARYFDQTIMGSSWETDGSDDFAYAIISNADDLPAQLRSEGYFDCNFAEWSPPG